MLQHILSVAEPYDSLSVGASVTGFTYVPKLGLEPNDVMHISVGVMPFSWVRALLTTRGSQKKKKN